jgi:hypothetical protein
MAKKADRDSVSALPILHFLCGGIGRAPSAPRGIAGTSHDALGAALRWPLLKTTVLTLSHFRNEPKTAKSRGWESAVMFQVRLSDNKPLVHKTDEQRRRGKFLQAVEIIDRQGRKKRRTGYRPSIFRSVRCDGILVWPLGDQIKFDDSVADGFS